MSTPSDGPVAVVSRPGMGRCLIARRDIAAGEIVLSEQPVVSVLVCDPVHQLQAFCAAPATTQALILDMFCPSLWDPSPLVQDARSLAAHISRTQPFARDTPLAKLHAALVVFQLNSHSFGSGLALFVLGCRLNHSCTSNTEYTSERQVVLFAFVPPLPPMSNPPPRPSPHPGGGGGWNRHWLVPEKKMSVSYCIELRKLFFNCDACHRSPVLISPAAGGTNSSSTCTQTSKATCSKASCSQLVHHSC